jgi:hypothetical protein
MFVSPMMRYWILSMPSPAMSQFNGYADLPPVIVKLPELAAAMENILDCP